MRMRMGKGIWEWGMGNGIMVLVGYWENVQQ